MSRRVVITGTGVLTPLGTDDKSIISALKQGITGFEKSTIVENSVVCPINDFNLIEYTGKFKNRRYLNRSAALSVGAAIAAIKNAFLEPEMLHHAGLFVGAGPNLDIENEFPEIREGHTLWSKIQALWILKFLPNTAASTIAQLSGIHGECATLGTACAASLQAIADAFRKIKDGYLDIALAGGGDSRLSSSAMMAYKKANAIYCGTDSPNLACRPFDKNRQGFVPGEGAAFFVMETYDHAVNRNANMLAEILGCGMSMDAYRMTSPNPDATIAEKALTQALFQANLDIHDIDLISAHGTGTLLNDTMEACLIKRLFPDDLPVVAIKSWIGHLSSACGAAEMAVCLACMNHGYIPEIRNLTDPCHMDINFIQSPKHIPFQTVLLENFGFGGQNCALIIRGIKNEKEKQT